MLGLVESLRRLVYRPTWLFLGYRTLLDTGTANCAVQVLISCLKMEIKSYFLVNISEPCGLVCF